MDKVSYARKWRDANKEKLREYGKRHYHKYKERCKNNARRWQDNNLETWKEYFSAIKGCEICSKSIVFNSGDRNYSVFFDHRLGGEEVIQGSPMDWLRKHPFNLKNKSIWESCMFGELCQDCNRSIPTKHRVKFSLNLLNYVLKGQEKD